MSNCVTNAGSNQNVLAYEQLKREIKALSEDVYAQILMQKGAVAELCKYIKENLSNTLRCLLDDMEHSGELDTIITDTVMRSVSKVDEKTETFTIPSLFGAVGDGLTDDTLALEKALEDGTNVNLNGRTYVITKPLTVKTDMYNGTIIYNGKAKDNIITLDGGGLINVNVIIKCADFAGNVVYVDYTRYTEQTNPMKFKIDGLYIDNTICDAFIGKSACIKIVYDKYKVIYGQNINDVKMRGRMKYGIYIEPYLRDANDNPVFNTSMFSNIFFHSVDCALKVQPIIKSGALADAKGEVELLLFNFANQYVSGVTSSFIDVHNTNIEGNMLIAWDYYGDHIPESGIYKMHNSNIVMLNDYFPATHNGDVKFAWTNTTAGEGYGNLNVTVPQDVGDRAPVRSTGNAWSVDNIKQVIFTPSENNPYNNSYIGFEIQPSNKRYSNNPTVQIGVNTNGVVYVRKYDSTNKKWGELRRVYLEGNFPTSYSGKRPDGVGVGDMKFDTTLKKPVWWSGSEWKTADGKTVY